MIIKAWIDSNANIYSRRDIEVEVDEEDWEIMDEKDREEFVQGQVFQYLDWGFENTK